MMDAPETLDLDPRGNRFPDSVKEVAYQLWAFVCSRRPGKVSELLKSGQYGDPVEVTERSIYKWAKDGQWSQRVQDDLRAIAPDLREQTITELIFGGLAGARYIRSVNEGWEERPDRDRITSSIAAVDRIGLSHVGKNDPTATLPNSKPTQLTAVTALSDDDLDQIERQASERHDRERKKLKIE